MISDKGKLIIIYALIAFILIIIGSFIIIGVLKLDSEKNSNTATTTVTTKSLDTTTTKIVYEESTSVTTSTTTTSTTTSTQVKTSTTSKTTKKTTTKKSTTTKVLEEDTNNDREITNSNTNYPNALDSWEWEIVDAINDERKKNGLNELQVATDLRRLAEEAADYLYDYTDEEVGDYLEGFSHYGYKSNHLDSVNGYQTLYNATKNNTSVTSDPYLKYLGVGVIERLHEASGLTAYYYIIIYE